MSTIPKEIQEKIFSDGDSLNPVSLGNTESYLKNSYWKSGAYYGYQLATDGREELEKENERHKRTIQRRSEVMIDMRKFITALQSSLKEKDRELNRGRRRSNYTEQPKDENKDVNMVTADFAYNLANQLRMEIESKDKQIEELKAENEKLNRLVPDHNSTPFT